MEHLEFGTPICSSTLHNTSPLMGRVTVTGSSVHNRGMFGLEPSGNPLASFKLSASAQLKVRKSVGEPVMYHGIDLTSPQLPELFCMLCNMVDRFLLSSLSLFSNLYRSV